MLAVTNKMLLNTYSIYILSVGKHLAFIAKPITVKPGSGNTSQTVAPENESRISCLVSFPSASTLPLYNAADIDSARSKPASINNIHYVIFHSQFFTSVANYIYRHELTK